MGIARFPQRGADGAQGIQGIQGIPGAPGGGGGGFSPPVGDLTGLATLSVTTGGFWGTFNGSSVVTMGDGTHTITGTVSSVNATDATNLNMMSGVNGTSEGILQVLAQWITVNYLAGLCDIRPVFQSFFPYLQSGSLKFGTGAILGLAHRDGTASIADITLLMPVGSEAAATLTLPVV